MRHTVAGKNRTDAVDSVPGIPLRYLIAFIVARYAEWPNALLVTIGDLTPQERAVMLLPQPPPSVSGAGPSRSAGVSDGLHPF